MSAVPYTQKPGSVAYRVIAWLETQAEGAEFTTSQIAEALNISSATVLPCLTSAMETGAPIYRRKRDLMYPRAPVYWSLVDHQAARRAAPPAPPPAADDAGDAPPPAANEFMPPPMAAQAETQAAAPAPEPPVEQAAPTPAAVKAVRAYVRRHQPAPAAPAGAPPRVAIWSDHVLQIDDGGQVHTFGPKVGQAMLDYLELRQRVARAAGAAA